MPPAPDRPPASARRMLSRIASPFAPSKSRHIADFSVNPDDEHRQYAPGDLVTGNVWLRVAKAIRVTHIAVCLHGYVQVYKTPGSPKEGVRPNAANLASGRGSRSSEHFGNGFASLFEDEVVLCGDGRLAEGAYQFNFEFAFPGHSLPSSIDFERGTISYMVTATLTRPNTVSPVLCHRKLTFVERIDIAPLYPPKARTITLAPLYKRSRAKNSVRKLADTSEKGECENSGRSGSGTPRRSDISSEPSILAENPPSGSPPPSESSFSSLPSHLRPSSQLDLHSPASPSASEARRSLDTQGLHGSNKVITVTMESQAGGCLQGDYIPTKVSVVHTKPVRSLCGVIVTLFRQARVDMRPSAPLGPIERGKDVRSEEYYPRSVTGLGGLSLSGAGSSHVFRKDLSQVVRPLYVDPQELTAEVHAGVHVPDEAFPTITTVPGSMISFRYYVEVIVDIQGKLHNLERGLINPSSQRAEATNPGTDETNRGRPAFVPYRSAIVETAQIRRDRGVVTCTFEVIVGTKDSERKKGKHKAMEAAIESATAHPRNTQPAPTQNVEARVGADRYDVDQYQEYPWNDGYYDYGDHVHSDQYYTADLEHGYEQPPPAMPLPHIQDESEMTEKQRIQQAEMRLLPSQPPDFEAQQGEGVATATAPYLPEHSEDDSERASLSAVPRYAATASGSSSFAPVRANGPSQPLHAAPGYGIASTAPPPLVDSSTIEIAQHARTEPDAPGPSMAVPSGEHDVEESPSAPPAEEAEGSSERIHDSHAYAAGTNGLPRYEQ